MPRFTVTITVRVNANDEADASVKALMAVGNGCDDAEAVIEYGVLFCERDDEGESEDELDECEVCGDTFAVDGPAGRSHVDPSICQYCYIHDVDAADV